MKYLLGDQIRHARKRTLFVITRTPDTFFVQNGRRWEPAYEFEERIQGRVFAQAARFVESDEYDPVKPKVPWKGQTIQP